jgi:hypothetical protein
MTSSRSTVSVAQGTITATTEMLDVTSMSGRSTIDRAWRYVDKAGHVHEWVEPPSWHRQDGWFLTIHYVPGEPYWCADCNDEHEGEGHYECLACGEVINPGWIKYDGSVAREYQPGYTTYTLNDQPISGDEARMMIDRARHLTGGIESGHG